MGDLGGAEDGPAGHLDAVVMEMCEKAIVGEKVRRVILLEADGTPLVLVLELEVRE